MLIKCPECNKEISDKSKICIHCGYPLQNNQALCLVNGKEYDLSFLLDDTEYMDKLVKFVQMTDCYFGDSGDEIEKIIKNKSIPKTLNIKTNEEFKKEQKQVHCPKCGSTSITTGARGVNFTFGLIGASKTVNRCANCGHTWKP